MREVQYKLAKTEKNNLFKPGGKTVCKLDRTQEFGQCHDESLSPFLRSILFCEGFLQTGSIHKTERCPSVLTLHPLFSAIPVIKGLLPHFFTSFLFPFLQIFSQKKPRKIHTGLCLATGSSLHQFLLRLVRWSGLVDHPGPCSHL